MTSDPLWWAGLALALALVALVAYAKRMDASQRRQREAGGWPIDARETAEDQPDAGREPLWSRLDRYYAMGDAADDIYND